MERMERTDSEKEKLKEKGFLLQAGYMGPSKGTEAETGTASLENRMEMGLLVEWGVSRGTMGNRVHRADITEEWKTLKAHKGAGP